MFKNKKIDWDKKILGLVSVYGLVPLLITPAFNMLVYFGTRLLPEVIKPHNIVDKPFAVDSLIPLVPEWMIIYVLAFPFWVVGFIILAREDREVSFEIFAGENVAKIICLIAFLAFPTTMDAPTLHGSGFVRWLSDFIYTADNSYNNPSHLMPSIHCLESWLLFRASLRSKIRTKKYGNLYVVYSFVMAVAICASTLLVKQHVFIDVVTGILVVEFGLFVSKKFKLSRFYYKLESVLGAPK